MKNKKKNKKKKKKRYKNKIIKSELVLKRNDNKIKNNKKH